MRETRYQHEYSNHTIPLSGGELQWSMAIQLGLSSLITSTVALGLFAWLVHLRIQPLSALLVALTGSVICGFLCNLNLQYSLYQLVLALARLTHEQLPAIGKENTDAPSFTRRWPLGILFQQVQEIEQRIRHYRVNERLTSDVREQALQQAREAAALAERNRIARELHDSIKQHIFGINASAAAAQAYWKRENTEGARAAVEDIERSAQEAQVEMQALLQQLRPAPLENASLLEALHIQAQALGFRTGAHVHTDIAALPENDRLLPGTQETIFRLIQEACANIARHARAQEIWLEMRTVGQMLHIIVRDDGQGFDPAHVQSGMGLTNLRDRTRALQGDVQISSQPGQGTSVVITIPLLDALSSPAEEARQRYELERAQELARRGYRLGANASFLGTALGWVVIVNGWWNAFLVLGVLITLLVTLTGFARGQYYRVRVMASAGRESRTALELAQECYRAGLGLLLPASLGILYLFRLVGPLGTIPTLWLIIGLMICLGGPIQFLLWRYTQGTGRYYDLLAPQELGTELERRQRWFLRALIMWGILSVVDMIFAHSLFTLPAVSPAQQNAYGMALILFLGGMSMMWNYQLIRHLKQQLHQLAAEQPTTQTQED